VNQPYNLETYLTAYIERTGIADDPKGPLFRTIGRGTHELTRTPLPSGEFVEFTLRWEEGGVPHAVHQAHVLEVRDGRITRDQVWCGGRWSATLLAEMAEASNADA